MKLSTKIFFTFRSVGILILITLSSCGKQATNADLATKSISNSTTNTANNPTNSQAVKSHETDYTSCKLSKLGLSQKLGSPETINQAIDLINALPKPLAIPCFLQALNRPLKVNTTSSTMSVQAAEGENNPRIFIFSENLVISVAPAGNGKNLMEFSYLYSPLASLKGELEFPVQKIITYNEPYTQIASVNKTRCSACHGKEEIDQSVTGTKAYISNAIKPDANRNVSLNAFAYQSDLCDYNNDDSYRCQMIRSLFDNGTLVQSYFSDGTPTFFGSLGF
jgi:hypothetical protein